MFDFEHGTWAIFDSALEICRGIDLKIAKYYNLQEIVNWTANRLMSYVPGCCLRPTDSGTQSVLGVKHVITATSAWARHSAAPSIWNKIPLNVPNAPSILTFNSNIQDTILLACLLFIYLFLFICLTCHHYIYKYIVYRTMWLTRGAQGIPLTDVP